jgi:serine/threonine protein kinase
LFTDRGQKIVKLADLGFAHQLANSKQLLNTFCGSPPYAAPELFADRQYRGQPVDLWALGVLLYFISTGLMPFRAQTVAQLKQLILDGEYHMPNHVSGTCQHAIRGLLQHVPSNRFTIAQLKQTRFLCAQRFVRPLPAFRLHSGLRRSLTVGSFYSNSSTATDRSETGSVGRARHTSKESCTDKRTTNRDVGKRTICAGETLTCGCSNQMICEGSTSAESPIAVGHRPITSNPEITVNGALTRIDVGLLAHPASMDKSRSNDLSADSGHGTNTENDGSQVDRLADRALHPVTDRQVFASLDSPRISFRSVERIAPSVDASIFESIDPNATSKPFEASRRRSNAATVKEVGWDPARATDLGENHGTMPRTKVPPSSGACQCCDLAADLPTLSRIESIEPTAKSVDTLAAQTKQLQIISDQEQETLRRLARLGISRSMLDNCADRGVRSNLVGIYRIVLHQVINAKLAVTGQESPPTIVSKHRNKTSSASAAGKSKGISAIKPVEACTSTGAVNRHDNSQRTVRNPFDTNVVVVVGPRNANEPQLNRDCANSADHAIDSPSRNCSFKSLRSVRSVFVTSDLQPMYVASEAISNEPYNQFAFSPSLPPALIPTTPPTPPLPLPPPPPAYANPVGLIDVTSGVIHADIGLGIKVPPPCAATDYHRLPSPVVPFKPGLAEYLEEERRWRKIQKRKKSKSKRSSFSCCLL